MKILPNIITLVALGLSVSCASAQSFPPATHLSEAAGHSVAASGEVIKAGGESGKAVVKTGAAIVAVPVMASGTIATASGEVISLVGQGTKVSGDAATKGGEKIWDFASGDPKQRPALDHNHTLPAAKKLQAAAADPVPSTMLHANR